MPGPLNLRAEGDAVLLQLPEDAGPYSSVVTRLRQERSGLPLDWTAVREAYLYGRGRPFPVGSRRPDAAQDEKAKVRFSSDEVTAFFLVYPARPGGRRLTEGEALALLDAYGVPRRLVDLRALKLALLRRSAREPEPVARGRAPVHGAPSRIRWRQGVPTDVAGFLAFAEGEAYPDVALGEVEAGQEAGTREPAGTGIPGLSARGRALPGTPGDDPGRLGPGLEVSADGFAVIARATGHLRLAGVGATEARVLPLLKVRDAQDLRALGTGVFPGSVIVEGDLETPFPVQVLGDLEVRGSAVRPRLEVMGSLLIRDGLIGHAGAPVRVGGVVSAGFFDRAYVIAHTAHVRRYSLKSRLVALDRVVAPGDAAIQGGLVA
ncbi:MAG: flagellar assembly protein A, partial [Deferrisomatales bacterium]